jgi:TonB family protein
VAFIIYDEKPIKSDTSMTIVNLVESFPSAKLKTSGKSNKNINSKKKIKTKQAQIINNTPVSSIKSIKIQNYDTKKIVNDSQNQIKSKLRQENTINANNITSPISKNIRSRAKYKIGTIENPHPEYPIIARKKGWQGRLLLAVHVDKNGNVLNVHVKETSGFEVLDKVSIKTVSDWKFLPARLGDSYVEDNLNIPVSFKLIDY